MCSPHKRLEIFCCACRPLDGAADNDEIFTYCKAAEAAHPTLMSLCFYDVAYIDESPGVR